MKRWTVSEISFLLAFLFWSAAGLTFTLFRITPAIVAHWPIPSWLIQFIDLCFHTGDPILILLAFVNTHLHAMRQWSAGIARRWALIIVVCSYAVEWLGATTGFPFGVYHYTDRFGPVLGVVPITIPLAWHVVVTNSLFIVRTTSPHLSQIVEAIIAGLLCTLYDFILEPFATTVKGYWVWSDPSIPPLNYVAWFGISALLIWIFAPTLSTRHRLDPRPWLILSITLLIFIVGRNAFK